MASSSITVGDTFPSYTSFREKLEAFQQETKTQFVTKVGERLSETDCLFDQFKYSVLRLVCKQGQKNHTTKASGERPNQRSYKVNCPVQMNVRLNRPKGKEPFLKVTKLEMSHENHQVSQEMFHLYPEQRRFCSDAADQLILSSKTMKTSERRELLEQRHGVAVMSQDVYNQQRKLASECGRPARDEDRCQEIGEKIVTEGGFVEVGRDEKGGFAFFAFITNAMLCLISKFPECLVMDCTYKVNHYLLPLLTIMIVDGEGHGMPVFHAFLAKEEKALIEQCLLFFSKHVVLSRVSCFIVDKDMSEIAAIASVFPNVPVNLCSFHIFQAVERHLRKELGRGASCVKLVLDLFMKQVSTESEVEFHELQNNIKSIVPQALVDYFESNWWSKRHMWAACCNVEVVKFTQTTTNTLESYHSKIKKHISEKLSLSNCLSALLSFDHDKIINARRQQVISFNSDIYNHKDTDETEVLISKSLTRFAADIVKHELSVFKKVVYDITPSNPDTYIVQFKDRSQTTSLSSCTCSTFGHLKLPCRHIFAVRRFTSVCLFDISVVPNRFLLAGIDAINLPQDVPEVHYSVISLTSSTKTVEGRYRKVKSLCERMMNVMSVMGEREFTEKLIQVQALLDSWTGGESSSEVPLADDSAREPEVAAEAHNTHTHDEFALPVAGSSEVPLADDSAREPEVAPEAHTHNTLTHDEFALPVAGSSEVPLADDSAREPEVAPEAHTHNTHTHDEFALPVAGSSEVPLANDSAHEPEVAPEAHNTHDEFALPVAGSSEVPLANDSAHEPEVAPEAHNTHTHDENALPFEGTVAPEVIPTVSDELSSSVGGDVVNAHQSSWPRMSKIKPRGRPSSKQKFTKLSRKRYRSMPLTYDQLSIQKQCQMLVSAVTNFSSLPTDAITPCDLKRPCLFHDIIMDDVVDVSLIKKYFDASAWSIVEEGIAARRDGGIFTCGHCKEIDNGEIKMIQCECCLLWYHFNCVNYSSKKRVITWFCENCM